jgi:hypothetical protein
VSSDSTAKEAEGVRPSPFDTDAPCEACGTPMNEHGRPYHAHFIAVLWRLLSEQETKRQGVEVEAATYRALLERYAAEPEYAAPEDLPASYFDLHQAVDRCLMDTQAGVKLLERMRQLVIIERRVWGYIALEGYCPVCDAERGNGDLVEHLAICPYHEHHQGTGAAGEEE